jgi:hypothetical protein
MNTSVSATATARYEAGQIIVYLSSGVEFRFPVAPNPRLAAGTPRQLNHIEISPYGLHWPDLDEDLSFRGLLAGDFGQSDAPGVKAPTALARRASPAAR